MAVWPGKHIARPRAQVEPFTIPPIPAAAGRKAGEAQLAQFL